MPDDVINPRDHFESGESPVERWVNDGFDFRTTPGTESDLTRHKVGLVMDIVALVAQVGVFISGISPMFHLLLGTLYFAFSLRRLARYQSVFRVSGDVEVIRIAKSYRRLNWGARTIRWSEEPAFEAAPTGEGNFADIAVLTRGKRTLLGIQLTAPEADAFVAALREVSRRAKVERHAGGGYRRVRVSEPEEQAPIEAQADEKKREI